MQTDEPQIFRFNWQVGVILGITALALIIPLIGVGFLANALLHPKSVPTFVQPEAPFRKSLEDIASQKLGSSASLEDASNTLAILAKDPAAETARVEQLARQAGGFSLPPEQAGEVTRLTVQIPRNQVDSFRQACRNPQASVAPAHPDSSTELLQIVISKPQP